MKRHERAFGVSLVEQMDTGRPVAELAGARRSRVDVAMVEVAPGLCRQEGAAASAAVKLAQSSQLQEDE